MKKNYFYFILSLSILTSFFLNAQEYVPLLNNSSWNITTANFGGSTNDIIDSGTDVVIGSYTYKKFTDPTLYSTDNYIREDVANRRVYRYVDGTDELLYDFNLNVSDEIVLGDDKTYTVTSVTDINVINGVRKRIHLVHFIGTFAANSETWIEGVGSSSHPLKPNYELIFSDPHLYLTCSAQNGENVYNHAIANGSSTPTDCSMLLNVNESTYEAGIDIYPNPASDFIKLKQLKSLKEYRIYNILGAEVLKGTISPNEVINISELKNGLYFLKVEKYNSLKFIKS
jgi:hypothetical protein